MTPPPTAKNALFKRFPALNEEQPLTQAEKEALLGRPLFSRSCEEYQAFQGRSLGGAPRDVREP